MGRIRVLTDRVANQIAAGEVVERPASVCKELIENSLDSGAAHIRIDLQAGGRRLIQVADNGGGMTRDDALLAFERHATSKLRQAADLLEIATLGFRGEALPSIASVSRVKLETRAADQDSGTVVEIEGGRLRDVRDSASPPGTCIAVRDLFYNVPARRKFLRTEKTELSHAVRVATNYSLAHIDKAIQLRNEHGVLLNVSPVKSARDRVYQVFGRETLSQLVELGPIASAAPQSSAGAGAAQPSSNGSQHPHGAGKLRLSGFVSEPQVQRGNRNAVYTFVNRRLVRDSLIQRAIFAAYENLMPKGTYPFILLFLELPAGEVDVNVHPAKTEVRFRNASQVFDFVRNSIRERLAAAKPAATLPPPGTIALQIPPRRRQPPSSPPPAPSAAHRPTPEGPALRPPPTRFDTSALSGGLASDAGLLSSGPGPSGAAAPEEAVPQDIAHSRAPLAEAGPTSLGNLGNLQLLGQVKASFIVASGEDGVWIIDQHVAHERILFEKVLAARLHCRAAMQSLLTPLMLTLTPAQMVAYDELAEEFRGNGFDLEPFDGRTMAVKAVPAELSGAQVEALIYELLDDQRGAVRSLPLGELRKRMAATIACHAAIKANMPLSDGKMRWLLAELAKTDCPMSCPHGRPIALKYDMRQILKAFHRA